MYSKARRSVVAACDIAAGSRVSRDMLTVKRPGFGIMPKFIDILVGRVARVDIGFDDVITWEML
jgi:sialic acid synthase SpsE